MYTICHVYTCIWLLVSMKCHTFQNTAYINFSYSNSVSVHLTIICYIKYIKWRRFSLYMAHRKVLNAQCFYELFENNKKTQAGNRKRIVKSQWVLKVIILINRRAFFAVLLSLEISKTSRCRMSDSCKCSTTNTSRLSLLHRL